MLPSANAMSNYTK